MNRPSLLIAAALALLAVQSLRAAEPRPFLHPLFSDGAVLQRGLPVPVWGWAGPGEKVTVEFAGQKASTIAGADGKWMARLPALEASDQPRVLRAAGITTAREVQNVVVGDVWVCSGQSNMEMGIGVCDVPAEIAAANHPMIRLLSVPRKVAYEPQELFAGSWAPCTPETVSAGGWGGFSAVGYFFGRELHRDLKVPIGLIHTSWGGTICEAWASAEGLAPLPDFTDAVAGVQATAQALRDGGGTPDTIEAWYRKNDPGTAAGWQAPEFDDTAWVSAPQPGLWEQSGLPGFDGIVWLRKSFDAPAAWEGRELTLSLGPVDDIDTTWINGVKVGSMEVWNQPRVYKIPAGMVKPGRNVIAVRVLDGASGGGICGQVAQMFIGPAGNEQGSLLLAGAWRRKDSTPMRSLNGMPGQASLNKPNVPTVLFNGMISPLLPYAIKGAIWYQGVSNAGRGYQYRSLLPAMITDWRAHFGVGDFPFYIVSLANFQQSSPQPSENDAWAELREAQAMTAKNLKNCGLAVAIDIGDAADIHPKNKLEVGRRLALAALARAYGRDIAYSGPWYKGLTIEEGKIRLTFEHAKGLAAKDGKLTGFAIAGEDRKFVWADAVIDGETVVVSSPAVPKPAAVRYAWHVNPVCNLINAAGLPAVPFRTDDWPVSSQIVK